MVIEIFVRNVYGKPTIYPANEAAELLAELSGKRTLSQRDLDIAHKLGHTVLPVNDPTARI